MWPAHQSLLRCSNLPRPYVTKAKVSQASPSLPSMLATDNNYRKFDSLNELKRVLPRNAGVSSCRKPGRQERNRISRACDFCRIKKAKVGEDFALLCSIGQRLTYGNLPNSAMVENPVASAREVKPVALTSLCGNPRALRPRQRKYNPVNVSLLSLC